MTLFRAGIRGKLIRMILLTFLPVVLLTTFLAASIIRTKSYLAHRVMTEEGIEAVMYQNETLWNDARTDVVFLSRLVEAKRALRVEDPPVSTGDPELVEQGIRYLEGVFRSLVETRAIYDQLRVIGADGREVVRVDMEEGKAHVVPEAELQNKSERYYFKASMETPPGECYISYIDLNREQGEIERPIKAMARVGAPVVNRHGKVYGVVIANILIERMLHVPRDSEDKGGEAGYWFTVDSEGYYLHHERFPEKEWGGPNDLDTGICLQQDYPDQAESILKGGTVRVKEADGAKVIFCHKLYPWPDRARHLVIGHVVARSAILGEAQRAAGLLVLAAVAALTLAALIATWYGKRIVEPITGLSKDMTAFRTGAPHERLVYRGGDEIGVLYESFNAMADQLSLRQEELEKRVEERTRELNESRKAALKLMEKANAQSVRLEEALKQVAVSEAALRRRVRWAEGLQQAGADLAACRSVEEVLDVAMRALVKYLDLHSAWIATVGEDGTVTPVASAGADISTAVAAECPVAVSDTGQPKVVSRLSDAHASCQAAGERFGFRSCATYPLVGHETRFGTLTIRGYDEGPECTVAAAGPLTAMYARKIALHWQRCIFEEEVSRLSLAVEQSPVSIVVTDTNGIIQYVNPKFSEISGYSSDEVLGKTPNVLKTGHTSPDEYEDLWATIRAGNVWSGEFLNRKKSGETYWEAASISPIRNELGEITGYVGIKDDVTELKQTTARLEEAMVAADKANQAKSEFLASMSHELRTPLNAIIGFSEVLVDQTFGEMNEKQQRYVDHILTAGRHLLDLINDILDLAKVEAGKMELDLSEVYVSELLGNSLVLIREKCQKHGVVLEADIADDIQMLEIQADRRKLKQVIFNLLSNAAKFTPDGGSITLSAHREGDMLVVSVADSGIGIDPEDQDRIFMEFEQVDSSYGKTQQGTGLGLGLSRRLVELHGGRIWVESEGEGRGSKFTFVIPISQEGRNATGDPDA